MGKQPPILLVFMNVQPCVDWVSAHDILYLYSRKSLKSLEVFNESLMKKEMYGNAALKP